MSNEIEEGSKILLDFQKIQQIASAGNEVIPAVAQDVVTGTVLVIGYVNELALKTAIEEKKATFWSTSRQELWIKGKTSGDYLELVDVRVNCEQNSILYRVRLQGKGSCHTRNKEGVSRLSCFYRKIDSDWTLKMIEE